MTSFTIGGVGYMATPANDRRYILIACKKLVGIFVSVWVRKDLVQHIGHLRLSCVSRGLMGYLGNKVFFAISHLQYCTILFKLVQYIVGALHNKLAIACTLSYFYYELIPAVLTIIEAKRDNNSISLFFFQNLICRVVYPLACHCTRLHSVLYVATWPQGRKKEMNCGGITMSLRF